MANENPFLYDETPGNNSTINAIDIAESCAPSGINNAIRELMAQIRELLVAQCAGKTSSGTDTITLTSGLASFALEDGIGLTFLAGGTNTTSVTLNVDSSGAKAVVKGDGSATALTAGDIVAGMPVQVVYDASVGSGSWLMINPISGLTSFLTEIVSDTTPQLGGDLDLNGNNIDFPTTANVSDCLDEDDMSSNSATALATQQSIKAYVDSGTATLTNKTLGATTLSGTMSAADQIIDQPVIRDYGETVNAIGSIGGGTQDIDLELGNVVSGTVDTSTTTFTFSNPSNLDADSNQTACSFTLFLTNGGSQTVNWPASVDWAGGTAPTLTSSGVDILTFTTIDGGTIWHGFAAGLDMQ